jgi:hypothetical protein
MTSEGALPSMPIDDWKNIFICQWQRYIRNCSKRYLFSKQNAGEASQIVICEVLGLMRYVEAFDAASREHGVERAISLISKTHIPCVERKPTESHRPENRGTNNRRERQLDSDTILKENARRKRLSQACSLLPSVSSKHKKESREHLLLIAILETKYRKEPVEKTFLQHFTRNECTKLNRQKEKQWFSFINQSLAIAIASNEGPQGDLLDLKDAISKLPISDQELFALVFAGKSKKEKAEIFGVSVRSIDRRLSEAKERLRHKVGEKKDFKHE